MHYNSKHIWDAVFEQLRRYVGQTWDIQAICSGTGSEPATVGDWLVNQQPPVGERLIRLWHFLDALGLSIAEKNNIPEYNWHLGELLTCSVITADELLEILHVKNSQTVLQILRGQEPASPKYTLAEVRELFDEQLPAKRAELLGQATPYDPTSGSPPGKTEAVPPAPRTEPKAATTAVLQIPVDNVVATAATLVGALLPLLRILVSDSTSPQQRSKLRELTGEDVFQASNLLGALSSERARQSLK